MPFPPYPATPAPVTWVKGGQVGAPSLRSDVVNAVTLLTQPPLFIGAQTGNPSPFTALSANDEFTAPATSYAVGAAVMLSGGSLPGNFSAGVIYYVVAVTGIEFQLSATSGGAARTITADGSGTIQQVYPVQSGGWTSVALDTQVTDAWGGHLLTSNLPLYYGMFPGFYLAEMTVPPAYTGGAGTVSAGIFAQEGTSPSAIYGGQRAPMSGTSGHIPQVSASRLLQFSVTGTYGGGSNNYAGGEVWQDTGGNITLQATASQYAQLQLTWVSSLTGNATLPVPDIDTWPAPPLPVGRTFMNKNIRDTLAFLTFPPVLEYAYEAGTATIAAQSSLPATGTTCPLDTLVADTRTAFSTGSNTWTVPVPGCYYLYGQAAFAGRTTSQAVAAGLTVQSANYNSGSAFTIWGGAQAASASTSEINCANVKRMLRLGYGDTVKLAAFQADSGSNAATLSGGVWCPRLITAWRSR